MGYKKKRTQGKTFSNLTLINGFAIKIIHIYMKKGKVHQQLRLLIKGNEGKS